MLTTENRFHSVMEVRTLGQAVFLAVMSNPDGLYLGELTTRVAERRPCTEMEEVLDAAIRLRAQGYVRMDDGKWYAPGPEVAVWESL